MKILHPPFSLLMPGVCSACGGGPQDRSYFLDTGLDSVFNGILYFCNFCVNDIAMMAGYIYRSDHEAMTADLKKQVEDLEKEVKGYAGIFDSFNDAGVEFNDVLAFVRNKNAEQSYRERTQTIPDDDDGPSKPSPSKRPLDLSKSNRGTKPVGPTNVGLK